MSIFLLWLLRFKFLNKMHQGSHFSHHISSQSNMNGQWHNSSKIATYTEAIENLQLTASTHTNTEGWQLTLQTYLALCCHNP